MKEQEDKVVTKCMGEILRILYNESQVIKEMFENIKFGEETKKFAVEELKKLDLVKLYCFNEAIEITPKGVELIKNAIDQTIGVING